MKSHFFIGFSLIGLCMLLPGVIQAQAHECQGTGVVEQIVDEVRVQSYCENSLLKSQKIYFKASEQVSREYIFTGGILSESKSFSNKGKLGTWQKLQFIEENHWIRETLSLEEDEFGVVKNKVELVKYNPFDTFSMKSETVREWFYDSKPVYHAKYSEFYRSGDTTRPILKEIYSPEGEILSEIRFMYENNAMKPTGFEEWQQGKILTRYKLYEDFAPEKVWQASELSDEEIIKRRENLNDHNRFLIAIIDSGFDYNHIDLAHQWWQNPLDPKDGKDNDGNGWVDDTFGWDQVSDTGLPTESSTRLNADYRPLSHGTHVAHIATRDLWGVGLIGFAGDYTQASYIKKVSAYIKKHKVKIVNMSLGLPVDIRDIMGLRDAAREYQKMVSENPETLFVFAAGNSGNDLDIFANRQYPASINASNVLKVGALDTDHYDSALFDTYQMAYFSNYGKKNVDVLAPGVAIEAASLGGGQIKHSGTSMASPFMVNLAAQLWQQFPELTAGDLRKIFIESAYPVYPEVPLTSKGFADLEAAKILARDILRARRLERVKSLKSKLSGPNCWNSSLYNSGLTSALHHTDGYEFRSVIESSLCQKVDVPQAGDIVALRRANAKGHILKGAHYSEIHGYTYIDEENGLSKNGTNSDVGYDILSHESILSSYAASQKKDCRIQNIPKEHCVMVQEFYRCQELTSWLAKNPWQSGLQKEIAVKVDLLEKEVEQLHFESELSANEVKEIIKEKVDALMKEAEALKEDSFHRELIFNRLESLRVTSF